MCFAVNIIAIVIPLLFERTRVYYIPAFPGFVFYPVPRIPGTGKTSTKAIQQQTLAFVLKKTIKSHKSNERRDLSSFENVDAACRNVIVRSSS